MTFDTGGYSIKPAARMHEMKFDMCGGAAVLEAIGAIAELGLPVRIAGVIGATENLVDARAVRPGDIVRSRAGITIEINNTDAEGRLVLADCLTHARELGRGAARRRGDADGRDRHHLRARPRGADGQRRRLVRRPRWPPARRPASASGACRSTRSTTR